MRKTIGFEPFRARGYTLSRCEPVHFEPGAIWTQQFSSKTIGFEPVIVWILCIVGMLWIRLPLYELPLYEFSMDSVGMQMDSVWILHEIHGFV